MIGKVPKQGKAVNDGRKTQLSCGPGIKGRGLESCMKRGDSGSTAPGVDFDPDCPGFTTKRRFFPVYQNPAQTYIMIAPALEYDPRRFCL